MGERFELDDVEAFTAGTVGAPGQRVFYLQARSGSQVVSLRLEKQQVAALGEHLAQMLVDLPQPDYLPSGPQTDFLMPMETSWVVGGLGAAYDVASDRIVLVAEELVIPDDDDDDDDDDDVPDFLSDEIDPGSLRVRITRAQAAAFSMVAAELVSSGRPSCIWCGRPMDPDGHPCPRMN